MWHYFRIKYGHLVGSWLTSHLIVQSIFDTIYSQKSITFGCTVCHCSVWYAFFIAFARIPIAHRSTDIKFVYRVLPIQPLIDTIEKMLLPMQMCRQHQYMRKRL